MPLELTIEALKAAEFRGPVKFYDGRGGMARQDFECVAEPRFGYFWQRESRKDKGRQAYMVDGREVASLDEAVKLLALPPSPDSPDEKLKAWREEFMASPKLAGRATRANSEARCNADAGPFAMQRAWLQRADHPWHVGLNRFSDLEREAGRDFPHLLYTIKSAAHEAHRLLYLFHYDRAENTGLRCARGVNCRTCPILIEIEKAMVEARTNERFPREIDDADIDAAKAWTCVGHVLATEARVIDGAYLTTKEDRERGPDF